MISAPRTFADLKLRLPFPRFGLSGRTGGMTALSCPRAIHLRIASPDQPMTIDKSPTLYHFSGLMRLAYGFVFDIGFTFRLTLVVIEASTQTASRWARSAHSPHPFG